MLHIIFPSVLLLLVTANVLPSSTILVTLMMDAIRYSEALVLTKATWRNIPEDGILHSHHREDLESYKILQMILFTEISAGVMQYYFTIRLP
jgi:hypothetical protein